MILTSYFLFFVASDEFFTIKTTFMRIQLQLTEDCLFTGLQRIHPHECTSIYNGVIVIENTRRPIIGREIEAQTGRITQLNMPNNQFTYSAQKIEIMLSNFININKTFTML